MHVDFLKQIAEVTQLAKDILKDCRRSLVIASIVVGVLIILFLYLAVV